MSEQFLTGQKKNVKRQKAITIADGKVKQVLLGISTCQPRPHQGQPRGADPRARSCISLPRAAAPFCHRAEAAREWERYCGCNGRRRLWQVALRGKERGGRNQEGEQEQSKGGEKNPTEEKHLGKEGGKIIPARYSKWEAEQQERKRMRWSFKL